MVAFLISKGAAVNGRATANDWPNQMTSEPRVQYRPAGGLTPLLYASRAGCQACVEALLKGDAEIDLPNPDGMTPLMMAIDNSQYAVARYLLDQGANPHTWDWWGRTPLYVVVNMRGGPDSKLIENVQCHNADDFDVPIRRPDSGRGDVEAEKTSPVTARSCPRDPTPRRRQSESRLLAALGMTATFQSSEPKKSSLPSSTPLCRRMSYAVVT